MATTKDSEMQDLMKYIMSGFPEDARLPPTHVMPCSGTGWSCPRLSASLSYTSSMLHTKG